MIISNFKLLGRKGKNDQDWVYLAEVDCTEGKWWWKKTKTRMIRRNCGEYWYFVDNGQWCPGNDVDALYRAWEAKQINE